MISSTFTSKYLKITLVITNNPLTATFEIFNIFCSFYFHFSGRTSIICILDEYRKIPKTVRKYIKNDSPKVGSCHFPSKVGSGYLGNVARFWLFMGLYLQPLFWIRSLWLGLPDQSSLANGLSTQ